MAIMPRMDRGRQSPTNLRREPRGNNKMARMNNPSSTSPVPVDTGKVAGRRTLRFHSIDEALADVERLVEADRAGRLKRLGNWTLGQALGHVATWAEYAFTGAPIKAPFFVRWIVGLRKRKYLYESMPSGVRIPRVEGGTLGTDPLTLEEGRERFRRAFGRLKNEPPTAPSPVFGMLTHEEAIALNLRHTELHLSFFVPE
jgi:hypothetical protein